MEGTCRSVGFAHDLDYFEGVLDRLADLRLADGRVPSNTMGAKMIGNDEWLGFWPCVWGYALLCGSHMPLFWRAPVAVVVSP